MVVGEFREIVDFCRRHLCDTYKLICELKSIQVGDGLEIDRAFEDTYDVVKAIKSEPEKWQAFCQQWEAMRNNETLFWVMEAAAQFNPNFANLIRDEIRRLVCRLRHNIQFPDQVTDHHQDTFRILQQFKHLVNKYYTQHPMRLVREMLNDSNFLKALPVIEEDGFEEILFLMEHGAWNTYRPIEVAQALTQLTNASEVLNNQQKEEITAKISGINGRNEIDEKRNFCNALRHLLANNANHPMLIALTKALRAANNRAVASQIESKLLYLCLYSNAVRMELYRQDMTALFSSLFCPLIDAVPAAGSFYSEQNKTIELDKRNVANLMVGYSAPEQSESLQQAKKLSNLLLIKNCYKVERSADLRQTAVDKALQKADVIFFCLTAAIDPKVNDIMDDIIYFAPHKRVVLVQVCEGDPIQDVSLFRQDAIDGKIQFSEQVTSSRAGFEEATDTIWQRIYEANCL